MKKYTIEEVAPECADLSFAFDDDGLTEAGTGDFCGNVFMLFWDRGWRAVLNEGEYQMALEQAGNVLEGILDVGTYEGPNVPCGSLTTFWNKYAEAGTLADRRRGVLAGVYPGDAKKKVSVFTNAAGVSAVVNEKFVNLFPKDALFSVSGRCNPVAVGLMDGGALHIIAIVCPINAELSRIEYAEAV